MRPTDLRFILPTEKTGEYLYPRISNDGCKLGFGFSLKRRSVCSRRKSRNNLHLSSSKNNYLNQSFRENQSTFSYEKRFIDYDKRKKGIIGTNANVGPGSYSTLDANKKRIKGSITYRKFLSIEDPETQNQYAYFDNRLMKTLEKPKIKKIRRIKLSSKVEFKRGLEKIAFSMNKSCSSNDEGLGGKQMNFTQYSKMKTNSTFGGHYSKRNSISSSMTKRSKVKSKMFEIDTKVSSNMNEANSKIEVEEAKRSVYEYKAPKTAPKMNNKRKKLDKMRKESIIERYTRMMNSKGQSEFIRNSANKNRTYF